MKPVEYPQYKAIKAELAQGWNTWNTRSITSFVHLPSGFALNLCWKQHYWLDEKYLKETLIGLTGDDDPRVEPGVHPFDGSYTSMNLAWKDLRCRIETAKIDDDLVILVTPSEPVSSRIKLIVETGMLWNKPGTLKKLSDTALQAETPKQKYNIFTTQKSVYFPTAVALTPFLAMEFKEAIGISTGKERSLDEIKAIISMQKTEYENRALAYSDLSETYKAVQAAIGWNTIYEPLHQRVVSTVGRLWNEEYGGYCLFGWDNFFMANMSPCRELAYANILEHLSGVTEEGFIPNDNRGNGCKSWDRSQPPVGSIMVEEIYNKYPENWFLEAAFTPLLEWNRWWFTRRLHKGLLCYGSHKTKNPCNEPNVNTIITARYESGMDDSPMYSDAGFDAENGVMELHDIGLNSLYIADCNALTKMAEILGKQAEKEEIIARKAKLMEKIEELWDKETGLYLNRHTDTNELSPRVSPTMLYPLLAEIPDQKRAEQMMKRCFQDPDKLGGEWILPSITRDDEEFPQQKYWKGAIWPPLNYLVYLGLKKFGFNAEIQQLAEKSNKLFLKEWKRKGYVCENYSSLTGTGDEAHLSSDTFHSWGALMGFIALDSINHQD